MVIELTSEQKTRLAEIAQNTHRSEDEVLRESMHWLLEPHESREEIIARSRQQIGEGRYVDHAEVVAWLEQRFAK